MSVISYRLEERSPPSKPFIFFFLFFFFLFAFLNTSGVSFYLLPCVRFCACICVRMRMRAHVRTCACVLTYSSGSGTVNSTSSYPARVSASFDSSTARAVALQASKKPSFTNHPTFTLGAEGENCSSLNRSGTQNGSISNMHESCPQNTRITLISKKKNFVL